MTSPGVIPTSDNLQPLMIAMLLQNQSSIADTDSSFVHKLQNIYTNKMLIINNTKSRKHKLFKKVNGVNGISCVENYYECCYHDIKVFLLFEGRYNSY